MSNRIIEIIQNINFLKTLFKFSKSIFKKCIDNLFLKRKCSRKPVETNIASNYPLVAVPNHIVHTPWQKSAGKLHFYGNVSWRYRVVSTRLTNADNPARWQPRTPFPTAVVRPSSRLPTSNWFGAFNFTKITGTWGRGTQVPLMVIIYGNGTGRSTAQTTREHGSLFSERGTRERGIFAGRCRAFSYMDR